LCVCVYLNGVIIASDKRAQMPVVKTVRTVEHMPPPLNLRRPGINAYVIIIVVELFTFSVLHRCTSPQCRELRLARHAVNVCHHASALAVDAFVSFVISPFYVFLSVSRLYVLNVIFYFADVFCS